MIQEISDTNFSPLSMMDDFGRVFFQSGRVFRAIHNDKKDFCLKLLYSELFKELSEKKLIPKTTVADFKIEGYELVLEHEKLLQTFQHEWSFSMIRNVALTILEVNSICEKYGYELKDAHMFNLAFRGTQPVWLDIGSILPKVKNNTSWTAYNEFLNAVVVPLLFWSENQIFIARKLLESIHYGITTIPSQSILESGLLKLLNVSKETYLFKVRSLKLIETKSRNRFLSIVTAKTQTIINKITSKNTNVFSYNLNYTPINSLLNSIASNDIKDYLLSLPIPIVDSKWKAYHQNYRNIDGSVNYSPRFKTILELIKSAKDIKTIIDLAGNEGILSELLLKELPQTSIIIADYDQNAIDMAYNNFRKINPENVTTLLLNLMYTSDMAGTAKRLRSDLVLALAITHHLILTEKYSLHAIFERISSFTNKYVMIEFMPLGLYSTESRKLPSIPEWYNIKWFKNIFEFYFEIIIIKTLEENRVLCYGKKRAKKNPEE